ncbi:hypothetical protein ACFL5X_02555 [Candidatus Omnitrophota bacterium]
MIKKSFTLILAILLIVILVTLAAALFFRSGTEKQVTEKYLWSGQAFWLAEAGIERPRNQLTQNWFNRASPGATNLGAGTYDFTVYTTASGGAPLTPNQLRVVATGTVAGIARQIEILLEDIPIYHHAVVAVTKAELRAGTTVHGDVYVDGDAEVQAGASIIREDDSVSPVNPVAYNADLVYTGSTATVDGTVEGSVTHSTQPIPLPTVDFAQAQADADFVLGSGATLSGNLADGLYYITGDVTIDNATLNQGGIICDGKIEVKNGFDHSSPVYEYPALANQSGTIEVSGDATIHGLVYCGQDGIELKTGAVMTVFGSIVAVDSDVELKTDDGELEIYFKKQYLPPTPDKDPPTIIYWRELQNPYPLQ